MVLGLASGKVSLARAHEAWAAAYEQERARIVASLGKHLLDIQHVGSTSILDVPAKPILDILVGVRDFDEAAVCVEPMIAIGYTYRGENGIPRRHYFVKGDPRTHHVHIVELSSDDWKATLRFRDLLRRNPVLAGEYAREKERLALLHAGNRAIYQREKDKIVERILAGEPLVISVRPFRASDQAAARALIEEGLGEHFGFVDYGANPDLLDIATSYATPNAFFVAELDGTLVGTTGLIVDADAGRLVRVAAARSHRRSGIATTLLSYVTGVARQLGLAELVAHTQPEWPDAMSFYRAHGFTPYGHDEVDVYLRRGVEAADVKAR